jgi:UV excision repair protein RAD23
MKVSVRTIRAQRYEFQVEATTTVGELKDRLLEKIEAVDKSWLNLIFLGDMLKDDVIITETAYTEKDFLVLLVRQPIVAKQAEATKEASENEKSEKKQNEVMGGDNKILDQEMTSDKNEKDDKNSHEAASELVTGESYDSMIQSIEEMGFPKDQIIAALNASYNNPARAVEFLTSGMPIPTGPSQGGEGAQGGGGGGGHGGHGAHVGGGGGTPGVFDFLRNTPQMNQLRLLAQHDPAALEETLNTLPRNILDVISQNRDEFISLLQEQPTGDIDIPGPGGPGAQVGGGAAPHGGQQVQINVTPEDRSTIEMLVEMGYSHNEVMEAYFLFDKDVQVAANYLLNHGGQNMGGGGGGH